MESNVLLSLKSVNGFVNKAKTWNVYDFQTYTIMPKSFYGIRDDIKWRMENEKGQLDDFIYKKGERASTKKPLQANL